MLDAEAPTGFPNEEILPDDYPVYGNYLYVADGKVIMSDWHGVTVGYMKRKEGFKEVRRCNICARKAALTTREGQKP
jgi:hypothetical protein